MTFSIVYLAPYKKPSFKYAKVNGENVLQLFSSI
jgi:hypothetical protein